MLMPKYAAACHLRVISYQVKVLLADSGQAEATTSTCLQPAKGV